MPLKLLIQPGGEKWYALAKKKLAEMKDYMCDAGLPTFSKTINIGASAAGDTAQIFLNSLVISADVSIDRIRILASDLRGTLLELINPNELVPTIDAVLLDVMSDNFGLVLPSNCRKADSSFDTALLINPSFARQNPGEYPYITHYLHGFVAHPYTIRRQGQQFVYLPDVDNGTLVVVNPDPTAFKNSVGEPLDARDGNTSICWIRNILGKRGSPEFIPYSTAMIPALPLTEDIFISTALQTTTDGLLTAVVLPSVAVGADAYVTLPVHLADESVVAKSFSTTATASVVLSVANPFPGMTLPFASVVCRRDADHFLVAGFFGAFGFDNHHVMRGVSTDATMVFSETFIRSMASNLQVTPAGVVVRGDHFAVCYTEGVSTNGYQTIYLQDADGMHSAGAYTWPGGVNTEQGFDISVDGVSALAFLSAENTPFPPPFYLTVQVRDVVQRHFIGADFGSGAQAEKLRTIVGAWTPDGHYFIAQAQSDVLMVDSAGAIVYEGAGALFIVSPWLYKIELRGVEQVADDGNITRRYKQITVGAVNGSDPRASETDVLVEVPLVGSITVQFSTATAISRIWTAALGGGVDDTRRVVA